MDPKDEVNSIPEMTDAEGLSCFLDQARYCGADCMAYINPAATDKDCKAQAWGHCLLLVNANRAGKHLAILARVGQDALDDARNPVIPPPKVRP